MHVIFPFIFLFCSVVAQEEMITSNQVDAGTPSEVASAEGRACGGCGGGSTITKPTITTLKPDLGNLLGGDLLGLLLGGLGSFSVLAFNILGIVLLALLLKNLLSDKSGGAAADPLYYSAPSSYADPLTYHKRSSVDPSSWSLQSIQESPVISLLTQVVTDAIGPITYHKLSSVYSSSWLLQNLQDSLIVTFLTQAVIDAIDKYNVIEKQ